MQKQNNRTEKLVALNKSRATHGRSNSRITGYADKTYGIWQAFRDRCKNTNRKDYKYYGGKGITYDPAWDKFEQFVLDMGDCPEGMTLDRVNNALGYSKDNCRWATRKTQSHNSSRVRIIKLNEESKPLQEWLQIYSIGRYTFYNRLKLGWTVEAALTTPKRKQNG